MPVSNPANSAAAALEKKSNAVSDRRNFIPRPELCRKNRKGRVVGYGRVPGFNLTLREIEAFLFLPHE